MIIDVLESLLSTINSIPILNLHFHHHCHHKDFSALWWVPDEQPLHIFCVLMRYSPNRHWSCNSSGFHINCYVFFSHNFHLFYQSLEIVSYSPNRHWSCNSSGFHINCYVFFSHNFHLFYQSLEIVSYSPNRHWSCHSSGY